MSLLLVLLITACALLLATIYIRFRVSVPKDNRKVWNKKDKTSLENVLQKVIGKNMTSYIVDTSQKENNTLSPYIPPNIKYNSSGVAVEQQVGNQLEGTRLKNPNVYNPLLSPNQQVQNHNQNELVNISINPDASQVMTREITSNQLLTNSELPNTIIYRKPVIERLDKQPVYTSPFTKKPSTPHSSGSKKKVIYFDNSKLLDGVGVSPILPDKKRREEPIYVPNSSFVNSTIVLEPISEMEYKPQQSMQLNISEEEATGNVDASMISVGDNRKSPKSILRKRDTLGNFANQSMNLSAQLNESDIFNSSILRKKRVDFDNAAKSQNLKRTRPVGFERSAPPPSETSFSREAQKRTKTSDTVMTNTTDVAPVFIETPKPILISPPNVDDSSIDNSMITESLDKNDSIILDFKFLESNPKRKIGKGRIGFSTPSILRNQKILRYDEDILQRKELAFYLLKGDPSPEKKSSPPTSKVDDNLGSSFNLSSLAKRSTDTISEDAKPVSTSDNTGGFTFNVGSVSTTEKKNEQSNTAPTFVIPTSTPSTESTKKVTENILPKTDTITKQQIPAGLDLSAFKQPEPKPTTDTAPTFKFGVETDSSNKPASDSTLPIDPASKFDNRTTEPEKKPESSNPFASLTLPSSSETSTGISGSNTNPFANLKLATSTETKKSVLSNPFAANTSTNVFGTPSRSAFTSATPPKSETGNRVSDFAKMDASIFQRDTLTFGGLN